MCLPHDYRCMLRMCPPPHVHPPPPPRDDGSPPPPGGDCHQMTVPLTPGRGADTTHQFT